MTSTKMDLLNELAAIHGYRSYLEICTPTTGAYFGKIDRSRYSICRRLMYGCPPGYEDGLAIDFRSEDRDIASCLAAIRREGVTFDSILVDPFHEYLESARDIDAALTLLNPRGTIVVHDCLPPDERHARPAFRPGSWCGVTYKAYLDRVFVDLRLVFCTVDMDFGCGVIRRRRLFHNGLRQLERVRQRFLIQSWLRLGDDFDRAFATLCAEPVRLLNLVGTSQFLAAERDRAPVLW